MKRVLRYLGAVAVLAAVVAGIGGVAGLVLARVSPAKNSPAALSTGHCANAEGDSVPCSWVATEHCGLSCQRAKCHQAGKRWVYEATPECQQQYAGAPEAAFGWPPCGTCEGGK